MSEQQPPLDLGHHRLVAATVEDDSVTRWECLDCDREFDCASECLTAHCTE